MVIKNQTLEDKLEAVLDDKVNHPAHYTYGSIEVIDVIEGLKLLYASCFSRGEGILCTEPMVYEAMVQFLCFKF